MKVFPPSLNKHSFLLSWCLVVLMMFTLGLVLQHTAKLRQIMTTLNGQMPARIEDVINDVYVSEQPEDLFLQRINQDLSWSSSTPTCAIDSYNLATGERIWSWPLSNKLIVNWQLRGQTYRSIFEVNCRTNWPRLVLAALLSGSVLMLLWRLAPRPLRACRATWLKALLAQNESWFGACAASQVVDQLNVSQKQLLSRLVYEHGIDVKQALNLVSRSEIGVLTEHQQQWFLLGLQRNPGDIATALGIACADEGLVFDPDNGLVYAHGLPVQLSKTPYFYYLWYARMRVCNPDDGWYINPAVNRPDVMAAEEMMLLMEQFGGHRKAINDLQQHGLRAKTLDQNRNKIKDELLATLGEQLAEDYLFDTERDLKTGRSRYRLILNGEKIALDCSRINIKKANKNIALKI